MYELNQVDFPKVLPLLKRTVPFVYSIIEKNKSGRIFADDNIRPSTGLAFNQKGFHYLFGDESNSSFNKLLYQLILEKVSSDDERYFEITTSSEIWEKKIEALLRDRINCWPRIRFILKDNRFRKHLEPQLVGEFHIMELNENLVLKACNLVPQLLDFCWESPEDFTENGLGYCLLHNDEIISICYSCFICSKFAEIDIKTVETFRMKGLAKIICVKFLEKCLRLGLSPIWDCRKDNYESYSFAKSLGFKELEEYNCYWRIKHK